MEVKQIVIFGEDGLLARSLADILIKDPSYKVSHSYLGSDFRNIATRHMTKHAWKPEVDATDKEAVDYLISHADLVINCAGLVNTDKCEKQIVEAYYSNIRTAQVVAQSCLDFRVRLVHLATTASYGSGLVTEESLPTVFQTIYSGTKLIGEELVRKILPEVLIIRPCFIFGGKRDLSSVLTKLIKRHVFNKHPEWEITLSLDNQKDYLWVEDFAEAVKLLIDLQQTGVYDVSKGTPIIYREILEILATFDICVQNVVWRPDLDYLGNHLVSNEKLTRLGWQSKTSILDGIAKQLSLIKEMK